MSKVVLAVLAVCVVGAAVAVLSKFTDPLPEAVYVGAPAQAPPATDGGASFARDWERAVASAAHDESALWEVERRWIAQDGRAVMDAVAALEGRWKRKAWALSLWLDATERAWAAWHVIDGTFTGVSQRGRKGIVEHIPMIERLYADLPPERRSKHVAYFLYRHFEQSDPHRAARYKAEAGDDYGKPWDFYPPD